MKTAAILGVMVALLTAPVLAETPLIIVAAENFYGDIASQIAGPEARVTSILSNPDQDPHLFEASPAAGRALSSARLVIYNGVDYDPWMAKLLRAAKSVNRRVVVVGEVVHRKPGDNPHLWYDLPNVAAAARAIAAALTDIDPAAAPATQQRLDVFLDSLKPIQTRIAAIRTRFTGAQVTATEPVFGLMATALGLQMRNERFQLAVMNGTEPRASDVAAFEADLRQHRVRVLLYNSQASDSAAKRLLDIARQAGIPVVGVTETEPAGQTYQTWMMAQLDALDAALEKAAP